MPLTELIIKNTQPKEKKYKIFDKDGLYLLVLPAGGKYFKYDYRFNGVKKECSLGVYPKVTLKAAREKLIEIKRLLASGINPNEIKKTTKYIVTGEHTFGGMSGGKTETTLSFTFKDGGKALGKVNGGMYDRISAHLFQLANGGVSDKPNKTELSKTTKIIILIIVAIVVLTIFGPSKSKNQPAPQPTQETQQAQ